jgi:hypothetical protein
MQLKMISCEVFTREANYCASMSPHVIDIEYTEKNAHNHSPTLRQLIQDKIAATESAEIEYDAILLGFGLCGNSIVGLKSTSLRLVVPRAHDCCALCLGSRLKYREEFQDNPSTPFSSAGYLERGGSYLHESTLDETLGGATGGMGTYEQYVEQYGEENARYIMDSLHVETKDNRLVYIDVPEFSHLGYADRCRERAEADGLEFALLPGDLRLFRMLTSGEWNDDEFLVLEPGEAIQSNYDWDRIIKAE